MEKGQVFKIVLGIALIGVFVKILATKSIASLTILNRSKDLKSLASKFDANNEKITASPITEKIGFVSYDFRSPYGNINTKFFDDKTLVITKTYNNSQLKGFWTPDGVLTIENLGEVNEGEITQSIKAVMTQII
jgi:hypothetical protein